MKLDVVGEGVALVKCMHNYFTYFNLPVDYNVDSSLLLRVYLERQTSVHPDCGGVSDDSVLLNVAYRTLSDPLSRAQHLLDLKGVDTERMSPELAVKMFAVREQYDSITSKEERKIFCNKLAELESQLIDKLSSVSIEEFIDIFSEVKFIHSFLEKANSDCDRY